MNIFIKLEKIKSFWFLLITSCFFFLLRLPSLFEPYWYGDEGIYETIGFAMRQGRQLYEGVWDNKPPLLYVVYALFNGDQFSVRLLSLLTGIIAIVVFYFLANKLFAKTKVWIPMMVTALFALLFGLPLLEGNIANAENFILPLTITTAYLIFLQDNKPSFSLLFLAGLLVGCAFLFKIVGLFDFAAFVLFLLFYYLPGSIKKQALPYKELASVLFPFFLGFFLPIGITCLYFLITGSFSFFYKAAFTSNIGYVGYGNQFLIPQGLLMLKLLLLGSAVVFLLFIRKKLTPSSLFILLWLSFSLFNAFFSQRPYTHYLLVLLPSFCLFIGFVFASKTKKLLSLCLLVCIVILVRKNFSFYQKSIPYYQNFFSFVTYTKSLTTYRAFFDKNTPNDYEVVAFLKQHLKKDATVFMWGNNAQLYVLLNKIPIGRFTVAYHMRNTDETMQETISDLERVQPDVIIIMPKQRPLPISLAPYTKQYMIADIQIYERI